MPTVQCTQVSQKIESNDEDYSNKYIETRVCRYIAPFLYISTLGGRRRIKEKEEKRGVKENQMK
jgi:hypothetical protein